MELKLKPLNGNFVMPRYSSQGAAGLDFCAVESGTAVAGHISKVRLGVAVEVPAGYALLLTARSGLGYKYGAGIPHGYGLIDSDYRGELFAIFVTEYSFEWAVGDRLVQGLLVQAPQATIRIVSSLSPTARGSGGFGSTGV